jgi:hypothetical protein
MQILVKDVRVNPRTGHCEVDVVAVNKTETSTVEGPLKTYGVDANIIKHQYNGDVNLWLASVKGQHESHHGHHMSMSESLANMKGKEL